MRDHSGPATTWLDTSPSFGGDSADHGSVDGFRVAGTIPVQSSISLVAIGPLGIYCKNGRARARAGAGQSDQGWRSSVGRAADLEYLGHSAGI